MTRALLASIAVSALLIPPTLRAPSGTVAWVTTADGKGLATPGTNDFIHSAGGVPMLGDGLVWVQDAPVTWDVPGGEYLVHTQRPGGSRTAPMRVAGVERVTTGTPLEV